MPSIRLRGLESQVDTKASVSDLQPGQTQPGWLGILCPPVPDYPEVLK